MFFYFQLIAITLFSEEVQIATTTPIWVPLTILVLVLLMFVWGLTRSNVTDENLPAVGEGEVGDNEHGDPGAH